MPGSVRRKSSAMDLSKLTRIESSHPYNLRTRNRCMNYNERQRHQTPLKLLNQSDISLHSNPVEIPCSSNSLGHSRNILQERGQPETKTLYVNEDFGKSAETSSINVIKIDEDDAETEEDYQSENTIEVEENTANSSEEAELSDTSYRRNYSASAYDYQELVGHSNAFQVTRSASQSGVRNEITLGDNLRDFDALATGDGGHNDPNVLEFSVRILDNNENYF